VAVRAFQRPRRTVSLTARHCEPWREFDPVCKTGEHNGLAANATRFRRASGGRLDKPNCQSAITPADLPANAQSNRTVESGLKVVEDIPCGPA